MPYDQLLEGRVGFHPRFSRAFLRAGSSQFSKHIIFLIDRSGSMSGSPIQQAKEGLARAIGELKHDDFFNIVQVRALILQVNISRACSKISD